MSQWGYLDPDAKTSLPACRGNCGQGSTQCTTTEACQAGVAAESFRHYESVRWILILAACVAAAFGVFAIVVRVMP